MKRNLPSLNALRAFEAAARLGRMTDAARELGVTHGAVSRQVRALEDVMGVKLFEGPKNRLVLTEPGVLLLPELTASLDRMERAVLSVADIETGVLDVSCLGTLTMRWLIPRLHRFQGAAPQIEVRLSAGDRTVDFTRDSFEVAIRVGKTAWPKDAIVAALFEEAVGPVARASLLHGRKIKSPDDLTAWPLLHTRTRRYAWTDWAARAGWEIRDVPGREFEHFYFLLEAAISGLGIAIAPWQLVTDDIAAGRLVAPFGFLPSGQTYVALRRTRRNKKAEAFVRWLVEEAATLPAPQVR
jgi:LysR family transcriptional regulator, glycine cleavage system transcriptional activator